MQSLQYMHYAARWNSPCNCRVQPYNIGKEY